MIASQINVLFVVSEVYPLVKTGGLADVTGALPQALLPETFKELMVQLRKIASILNKEFAEAGTLVAN